MVAFALGLAVLVGVVARVIDPAISSRVGPGETRLLAPWATIVLMAATFLGAAVAWWLRRRTLPVILLRGSTLRAASIALACGIASLALSLIAILLRSWFGVELAPSNEGHLQALAAHPLALVLLVVLVAPVVEELVFRHMLLRRFLGAGRPWLGLLLTSLLFGVLHEASAGDRDLATHLLTLGLYVAMGAVLGLAYIATGRYWVAVAAHALNNAVPTLGMLAA